MAGKFQQPKERLDPYSYDQYHYPGAGRVRREILDYSMDGLDYVKRSYEELDLDGTERILSVGVGDGRDEARWAVEFGHTGEIIGLELPTEDPYEDPFFIARLELEAAGKENVRFVAGDAHALPFGPESFDVVTWRHSGYHFADIRWALWESYNVLKLGGKFQNLTNGSKSKPFQHEIVGKIKSKLGVADHYRFSRRFDLDTSHSVLRHIFKTKNQFRQISAYPINHSTIPIFENAVRSYKTTIPAEKNDLWAAAQSEVFQSDVYPYLEEGILDPFERGGGTYIKVGDRLLHGALGRRALWLIRPKKNNPWPRTLR